MKINSINKIVIYLVMLLSSFLIFFCMNESSMAIECLFLFGILLICKMSESTIKIVGPSMLLMIFFAVSLTLSGRLMERGNYNIPWKFEVKFIHLMFAVMSGYAMTVLSKNLKKKIMISAIISIIISSIISIYYVIFVHTEAIRFGAQVGITGTFSFDQLYGIVVFAPSFLLVYLSCYRKIEKKYLFLLANLIIFSCILMSALTTAILLVGLGVALIYIFNALEKRSKAKIILWLVIIILLISTLILRKQIGEILFSLTYNLSDYIKYRLQRIIDIAFGTEHANAYTMNRRLELANYSISTFKNHPIFGIGISGIKYGVIGYHQEWLDVLGVCGVFGTAIIAMIMYFSIKVVYNNCENDIDKKSMLFGIIIFFILGFLNPCMVLPELYTIYVILPNLSILFSVNNNCTK